MGAALEPSAPPGAKPSFKSRFKAWWEGYDLDPAEPPTARVVAPVVPAVAPKDLPVLEQPHVKVAQHIWGEGFTRPGGAAAVITLVKPFGLNPSMSVMDFGAGLGGGTRAVSEEFGVWVSGFEPDPVLAAGGHELTVRKGAKKAEVKPCVMQDFQPKAASFDCIYSCEALYTVPEKEKLLAGCERALKIRGQIAFTDFVRTADTKANDPRLADFATPTGKPGHFWSGAEYAAKLKGLKFDIRVDEDLTEGYRNAIVEAWVSFTQDSAGNAYAKSHPEAMVSEVSLWTKRVSVLDSGALQLRRFYAIKMGSAKSV